MMTDTGKAPPQATAVSSSNPAPRNEESPFIHSPSSCTGRPKKEALQPPIHECIFLSRGRCYKRDLLMLCMRYRNVSGFFSRLFWREVSLTPAQYRERLGWMRRALAGGV